MDGSLFIPVHDAEIDSGADLADFISDVLRYERSL